MKKASGSPQDHTQMIFPKATCCGHSQKEDGADGECVAAGYGQGVEITLL